MLLHEKDRLLELFASEACWCQDAEARDPAGESVHHDDASAVAWDLTGGMCRLFGWQRASELFIQVDRHIHGAGRRVMPAADREIAAMVTLQNLNDDAGTSYEMIIGWLRTLPVGKGNRRSSIHGADPNIASSIPTTTINRQGTITHATPKPNYPDQTRARTEETRSAAKKG